ncbi:MAG: hypothetical protein U5R48_07130 [Gammaproteobacteria bacterium]|nr:hypothetical protein [Gammaproteobacteria bacterium]
MTTTSSKRDRAPGRKDAPEKRIRIRRSDGRIQYVTPAELDELNLQRKLRDQRNGGRLMTRLASIAHARLVIAAALVLLLGTLALALTS